MPNNPKSNKFYITTAIDYVNGKPHIGHALEKIQADVVARYHRTLGDEVRFLAGTDEHGATNVRAAQRAGKDISEFIDENAENFKNLKQVLNLSWDDFIRTSDQKRHWPGTQKLWQKLYEAGDLYKKQYRGLYCVGHEAFVTEKDLVDGKCRDHQKEPEIIEEENWFFRLSKYSGEIGKAIKNNELKITPDGRKNEILALIDRGLEDVSFSRPAKDLSWGIPVPDDSEHTIYVWCDALSNYITAIDYAAESALFQKWWPADVQVVGKDILRFHAAIWPGMLLSAGLPLPRSVFVHGFITVEGQKMSKTIGNVIDPVELVEKYGTDSVRYYLLREIPTGEDGDFSYKKFEERYNGDLANGLGNLVARVATLGEKISPIRGDAEKEIKSEIKKEIERVWDNYEKGFREFRLNEALASVWELISFADKYINDTKPWGITNQKDFKAVIINASYLIDKIRYLLMPFLPETAERISQQISFEKNEVRIGKSGILFPRLTNTI